MNLHILHTFKGILSFDVAQILRNRDRDPLLINNESSLGNSRLDLTRFRFQSFVCSSFSKANFYIFILLHCSVC